MAFYLLIKRTSKRKDGEKGEGAEEKKKLHQEGDSFWQKTNLSTGTTPKITTTTATTINKTKCRRIFRIAASRCLYQTANNLKEEKQNKSTNQPTNQPYTHTRTHARTHARTH